MRDQSPKKKEDRQILVFKVSNDELGLDISFVREVLRTQEVFSLPKTPEFVEGVINLRGHVVPLIDLGKRLYLKPIEEPGKRIIVCRLNKIVVGLTVDSLKEIIAVPEENIKPMPKVAAMQMDVDVTSGLAKIGERIVPLLDLTRVITKEEATELLGRE